MHIKSKSTTALLCFSYKPYRYPGGIRTRVCCLKAHSMSTVQLKILTYPCNIQTKKCVLIVLSILMRCRCNRHRYLISVPWSWHKKPHLSESPSLYKMVDLGKDGDKKILTWWKSRVGCRVARWFVFKPKIPIWVNFGGSCNEKSWYILWPFGLFYGHWKYLMAIWYSLG
jgi:hypothetical protein